jgi:hypothetical protein
MRLIGGAIMVLAGAVAFGGGAIADATAARVAGGWWSVDSWVGLAAFAALGLIGLLTFVLGLDDALRAPREARSVGKARLGTTDISES